MTYIKTKWTPSRNAPLNVNNLNKIEDELETLSNAAYTGGVGTQGPRGFQGANGSRGLTGLQGTQGTQGEQGDKGDTGDSASPDWWHYIGNTKFLSAALVATGDVLSYSYGGVTVYRYITTAVTGSYPTEDAFYSGFDGTTLTTLIVSR